MELYTLYYQAYIDNEWQWIEYKKYEGLSSFTTLMEDIEELISGHENIKVDCDRDYNKGWN